MKRYRVIFLLFAVLAVVVSCSQPFAGSEATDPVAGSTGSALPPDQINDVARPPAGTFTFETVFAVTLNLDVNLFETDENGRVVGDELASESAAVFAILHDSEGNPIYSGKVSTDGTLNGVVILPSAREDITMTLTAEGFEDRSIVISDMVALSEVNRTMSLERIVPSDGSHLPRAAISGLLDSDGDGVPNVYDAFPKDPGSAFKIDFPAEGKLTIAFEDLFGEANAGDADYNDFVAAYSITETLNDTGLVTSITVSADAVTKLAGYDHRFGIRIDSFTDTATLTGSFIDDEGASVSLGGTVSAPAEVVLFENSRYAVEKSASFTLTFAVPQDRGVATEGETLSSAPYNPFAIVINTGHDIHLIGREPLTVLITSKNPDDTFVDGDGFPWALLVPDQWDNPDEGQRIEIPYPRFTLWRELGGEEYSDWYLHSVEPVV
ncbi:MAG: LruC domain-containing protein, partial [Spirochaetales bacterium]|nr:LruC domain-containing protein [Spirochaetales bacterium]